MRSTTARLTLILLLFAAGWSGWWLMNRATSTPAADAQAAASKPPPRRLPATEPPRSPKSAVRSGRPSNFDREAADEGALPGQRWLKFQDRDALERFLKAIEGKGIAVLGSLDELNTLRIGFFNADELAGLLDGSEESGLIFPVNVPGGGSIQDGAVGFGAAMLDWLGAAGDRSSWGSGIMIAVLDTGIAATTAFANHIRAENLVALPEDLSSQNGHGTAVGSLIGSEFGLAPASTLLSYRVADDTGYSDSFTLAQAVIAAADAGAHIINISMGSTGNSSILKDAVEYARAAGSVIVASAGNDGTNRVSYPAAYPGVVAVGAVDANGSHLEFSNQGSVSITAPGLDVLSAWTGDQTVLFTGTSASAPIISGAIAAVMTTRKVSATQAAEILMANANEGGAPGNDPAYGEGIVDIGRVLREGDPAASDVALASNHVTQADGIKLLQVTVENRGSTTVINAPVSVTTSSGTYQLNVSTLPSGKTQTFELPISTGTGQEVRIDSKVGLSSGANDLNPSNNRRVDVYTPAANP